MTKIINLTQHPSTPEQGADDLQGETLAQLKSLLTFDTPPYAFEIKERAEAIAALVGPECTHAMIGGDPYLMAWLEAALREVGVQPLYSFSERVSVETTSPSGEVVKTSVFKHTGWVFA